MNNIDIKLEKDEDGWWVASVVLPFGLGINTQGKTIEEAITRLSEAFQSAGLNF